MRYYKVTKDGKLQLIGVGLGGEEITKEEYDALREEIENTPFEMPEIAEEEISAEEALEIILGGDIT